MDKCTRRLMTYFSYIIAVFDDVCFSMSEASQLFPDVDQNDMDN